MWSLGVHMGTLCPPLPLATYMRPWSPEVVAGSKPWERCPMRRGLFLGWFLNREWSLSVSGTVGPEDGLHLRLSRPAAAEPLKPQG